MKMKVIIAFAMFLGLGALNPAMAGAMAGTFRWGIDGKRLPSGVSFASVDSVMLMAADDFQAGITPSSYADAMMLAQRDSTPETGESFWYTDGITGTQTGLAGEFYIVLFNATQSAYLACAAKFTIPSDGLLEWNANTSSYWAGSTWADIGAVPEPTSLALLALGAAAMGLRRRVS